MATYYFKQTKVNNDSHQQAEQGPVSTTANPECRLKRYLKLSVRYMNTDIFHTVRKIATASRIKAAIRAATAPKNASA